MIAHHHLPQAHRAVAVAVIVQRPHQAHPVIHRLVNRMIQSTTIQNASKTVATKPKRKKPRPKRSTKNDVTHRHRQVPTNRKTTDHKICELKEKITIDSIENNLQRINF